MKGLSLWDTYKQLLESRCNFLEPRLNNSVLIANNSALLTELTKFEKSIEDVDLYRVIILEALKFNLPLCQAVGGNDPESDFLFDTINSLAKNNKERWCLTPMGGSIVYKPKNPKPKAKAKAKDAV
eukprot:12571168-Alexandrium_andersonii.AAC.1